VKTAKLGAGSSVEIPVATDLNRVQAAIDRGPRRAVRAIGPGAGN
jgi:hypothetical protein